MGIKSKILLVVLCSFIFSFSCVGFAQVSNNLTATGSANAAPPQGIYITTTSHTGQTNANAITHSHIPLTTNLTVTSERGTSWGSGSTTYSVTVWNNTPYIYAYAGIEYESSGTVAQQYNGNSLLSTSAGNRKISVSVSGINTSTILQPNQKVTFTTTYTYGRSLTAGTDYKTLVNYKFAVNVDSVGDAAVDAVVKKFGEILNDTSDGGDYQTLIDRIDDKFDGYNEWTSNYIGNVDDSTSADYQTIAELFEGKLQITVDGKEVDVTLIIKREDVDGNLNTGDSFTATNPDNRQSLTLTGCEMTLYVTTDPLSQSGYRPVDAVVFTCDHNDDGSLGEWYVVGERYSGEANAVGYQGAVDVGSFDTGTWRSYAQTYNVVNGYSYSLSRHQSIKTVTQATDTYANNKLLSLLKEAKTIIDDNELAGSGMVNLREKYEAASKVYTVSANGTISLISGLTRSQAIPHIKALELALSAFRQ
ncbi:MAG: hypothetical protein IKC32_04615 [Clostridia bacterium]|nr:hypothetical protein [Clostridia bacterium]